MAFTAVVTGAISRAFAARDNTSNLASSAVNGGVARVQAQQTQQARQSQQTQQAGTGNSARSTTSANTGNSAASRDGVELSSEAQNRPNPYAGRSDGSTSVSVEAWRTGRNDSVEGILRNQGYSLNEIYSRDENGRTLIDSVARTNNLRNANMIPAGQSLEVPTRANTQAVSSRDVQNGESAQIGTTQTETSVTSESVVTRNEDGSSTLSTNNINGNNPNAGTSTTTEVGPGGQIDSTTRVVDSSEGNEGYMEITTTAQNRNGSAVTEQRSQVGEEQTITEWRNANPSGSLSVRRNADGTYAIVNPGRNGQPGVTSTVNFNESERDGTFENMFSGREANGEAQELGEFRNVRQTTSADGSTVMVGTNRDGQEQEIGRANGDSDDGWLEWAGSGVDSLLSFVGL